METKDQEIAELDAEDAVLTSNIGQHEEILKVSNITAQNTNCHQDQILENTRHITILAQQQAAASYGAFATVNRKSCGGVLQVIFSML